MEDTLDFSVITTHIIIMLEIEGLKSEIKSLKGKIVNQLQDDTEKRGFSSIEQNTKIIIDAMVSQKNPDNVRNSAED